MKQQHVFSVLLTSSVLLVLLIYTTQVQSWVTDKFNSNVVGEFRTLISRLRDQITDQILDRNQTISCLSNDTLCSERPVYVKFREISSAQKIWIYSVFYELPSPTRTTPTIVALGSDSVDNKFRNNEKPIFHLYSEDRASGNTTEQLCHGIKRLVHPGYHPEQLRKMGKAYGTVSLECPLSTPIQPSYVTFSWPSNSSQSERIPIIYPQLASKRNITVCYSVVFGGYDDAGELLQNLEFDRLMGAEHLYIYNHSVGPRLDAMMRSYVRDGLLTVLPMPAVDVVVRGYYHGHNLAIADCFYRNKHTSRYVALHDTDEYITPLKHTSWLDMIQHIEEKSKRTTQTAAFEFQHTFSCVPKNTTDVSHNHSNLTTSELEFIKKHNVSYFMRSRGQNLLPFPTREKTIYRPELVAEVTTHFVVRFAKGGAALRVDNAVAYLRHSRSVPSTDGRWKTECPIKYPHTAFYREYLRVLMEAYARKSQYLLTQ